MREADERYFERLESDLGDAFDVAERARSMGADPKPEVEIPTARDMADRVENILGIPGVAERVRELEGEMSREEAALELATDFAEGRVGDYESRAGKIEGAVRTAVALLTEGVVAAPIEGIDRVELLENDDGTEFVNVYYAGPIRSAGGTAQALSVLVADYARSLLGIDEYRTRDDETERYAEEVALYDEETGLQYSPKDSETKFIAEHMPIMLDGEATGDEEVSGYRDLERVDTNSARGGMCLVLAEGMALKTPKIQRYTGGLDEVEWPWLQDLIDDTYKTGASGDADEADEADGDGDEADDGDGDETTDGPPRADPSWKYLRDLIAGRPVFAHPSETGGFRLRYGRARNHGHATAGVHPATMHVVDDFLATGTQIKTERPGKAAGIVPVDSIEGPTVRLANGDVRRIDDPEEAREIRNGVEKILDLGEYLVNYGEFVENNHHLVPGGYAVEWWVQEFSAAGADVQALRDRPEVDLAEPGADRAIEWAREYDAPLHPTYTYPWHDVSVAEFRRLARAVAAARIETGPDGPVLVVDRDGDDFDDDVGRSPGRSTTDAGETAAASDETTADDDEYEPRPLRAVVEALLVEHEQTDETLRIPDFEPLALSLGLEPTDDSADRGDPVHAADGGTVADGYEKPWTDLPADAREWPSAMEAVRAVAPFDLRERAPTRIGNRMGRPEKSEERELSPAVHTLFPIGEAGGSQRDVSAAASQYDATDSTTKGDVEVQVGRRECPDCGDHCFETLCPDCETHTEPYYECPECEQRLASDDAGRVHCDRCEVDGTSVTTRRIDLSDQYRSALESAGERENAFDTLKGVKGLTSADKTPEPIEKGVLRAKHDVSAFKDGTVRYDMTDLPVTAVRPRELDVTADAMRGLGYETDVHGDPLRHDDQLVELRVQDVVLSDGAAEHMLKTADFVDDLLESFYGLEPFYEVEDRSDLVGELVFGMAPHTSAAVIGRVVGFTSAAVGYAHPYFHAAKRRNCFHPETKVWYEDESGRTCHETVRTLVEERLDDPREDDFGTLVQELESDVTVPSVDEEGDPVRKSVEAVSRHPAPDHLVRVETRSGRELTVTPDHSVRRWSEGIERVKASELAVGDDLPTPKSLSLEGTSVEFDLLREFMDADATADEDVVVRGVGESRLKEILSDASPGGGYCKATAGALDVSQSTVFNWVSRDSIPISVLKALLDEDRIVEEIPDDVHLGIRRDTAEVSRTFEVTEDVGTLLGYYAAGGFTRREKGSFYQTTVCVPNDEARQAVLDAFDTVLGIDAFEENEWKVTASSRLVATLFADVLDLGSGAEDKRVPDCIFASPDEVRRAFLAAYFSGDGSASSDRVEIRAHTVSDELRGDLVSLLKLFGIATKTYSERRTVDSGPIAEFYDDRPVFETNVLEITSENAARFHERIGFHLSRKSGTLSEALDTVELRSQRLFGDGGEVLLDELVDVETVECDVEYTYSLTVEETNSLVANDLYTGQCDGDEDCVMLLMDGLLNFSKQFLPDQRGGSVAEDSRLLAVDPDGAVRTLTFEEFWHELESPTETDGKFHKRTCYSEGWKTYTFDEDHEASLQPIEKAIRYRADEDEQLVRVQTQFGRSLDITEQHSLFRYDDGIEDVAGDDLSSGDLIVAPREFDVDPIETTIDVAAAVDDPYVLIDDHVEDLLRTVWESDERGGDVRSEFRSGLSYRLSKSKIAYDDFEQILAAAGLDVPRDVSIGLKGSSDGIPREIGVDEEFAWLLGLFVAEGTTSSVCPAIHNADEGLIDRAASIVESALDHEPGIRWSNRAYELRFPAVFRDVLYEMGFAERESYDSSEKVIPDSILRGPRPIVRSFLEGFIAGDGSDSTDDNVTTVAFHTTSDDVKDGIVFLLHRLGLVANVSVRTEREGNRQDIYTVTVSGGASDNPLHRVLDEEEPYHPKSLVVQIPDALMELREMDIEGVKQVIPKYLKRRDNVSLEKLGEMVEELEERSLPAEARERLDECRPLVEGDLSYLRVTDVERVDYDGYLYDLQVGGDPVFTANWLYAHNSMDAPLVMSSRIDPAEIDDEAHNVDVMERYPLEFYEEAREMVETDEVEDVMTIAEESLGDDDEYAGFDHTHDTTDVHMGPALSAYKTLGSMEEKMDAQLNLSRKLRAVDETDVAERIIEFHFLPDLIGNLRAFSRQETRCLDCGEKYRRMPLTGDCRECGGDVNLTVHEGSVNKYMDTAKLVAEEFGARRYTKQRLEVLERSIERIFEDDTNKASSLDDFM